MIHITRRERFCAAHMLRNENWNEQKNLKSLENVPTQTGMDTILTVCNSKGRGRSCNRIRYQPKGIKSTDREKSHSKLDHKNINLDVDFMAGKMASTEVLAIAIWKQLELKLKIWAVSFTA